MVSYFLFCSPNNRSYGLDSMVLFGYSSILTPIMTILHNAHGEVNQFLLSSFVSVRTAVSSPKFKNTRFWVVFISSRLAGVEWRDIHFVPNASSFDREEGLDVQPRSIWRVSKKIDRVWECQ
mmetsp:Transcript_16492/g.16667  ORF Transcript_16492/g.16667 Transcript_16492/m.16667 type:complete len:122 (-) Transcript_16492:146-511(-)